MVEKPDFEKLVACHYHELYQFAYSLTRSESESCDLTQETFCIWAAKGHQLRDGSKVKSWLFTTLHREFLGGRRRHARFPHVELEDADAELPTVTPELVDRLDAQMVVEALGGLDEVFRAPVALFYLQDYSYMEIAEILSVPVGTIKSRLARGIIRLNRILTSTEKKGGES